MLSAYHAICICLWIPSFWDRRRHPQADQRRVGASQLKKTQLLDNAMLPYHRAVASLPCNPRWPLFYATCAGCFAIPHASLFPCHPYWLLCHTARWPLCYATPRHRDTLMHPHPKLICNIFTLSHTPGCSPVPSLYWTLPRQATPTSYVASYSPHRTYFVHCTPTGQTDQS